MWISWKGVNHKYQGINYNPLNPVHFPQIHELEELEQQLVEFGLSSPFDSSPDGIDIGIPYAYRAPETILEAKLDKLSEVWSLGCVLYE